MKGNKGFVVWEDIPEIDEANREYCLNCQELYCDGCTSFYENKKIDVSKKRYGSQKSNNKMGLGNTLRALRINKGLKLKELSELTGIPVGTLGGYESEVTSPSDDRLKKILEVLEGSV